MSLFRKALNFTKDQDDITSLSGSEYDDDSDVSLPPSPVPKRQRMIPKKFKEYLAPAAEYPKQLLKGWCIIEWAGENSYDPVAKKDITTLDGDCPKFEKDETVLAKYSGKRYRGTIAVTAATKMVALQTYTALFQKRNEIKSKEPAQEAQEKNQELKKMQEVLARPAVPNFARKEQQPPKKKRKNEHREDKTAQQLKNEEKVRKNKAQLKQMCEAVFTTTEKQEKIAHLSKAFEVYVEDCGEPSEKTGNCCQCCAVTKLALERQRQEMDLMRKKISALTGDLANIKGKRQTNDVTVLKVSPICKPQNKPVDHNINDSQELVEVNSKDDKEDIKQQSYHNCPQQLFSARNILSDIPHHLKSKAANVASPL